MGQNFLARWRGPWISRLRLALSRPFEILFYDSNDTVL